MHAADFENVQSYAELFHLIPDTWAKGTIEEESKEPAVRLSNIEGQLESKVSALAGDKLAVMKIHVADGYRRTPRSQYWLGTGRAN